jgi:hypothetical protein
LSRLRPRTSTAGEKRKVRQIKRKNAQNRHGEAGYSWHVRRRAQAVTMLARQLVCAAVASLPPLAAMAQDAVVKFRLAQDPKNIQGCTAYDSTLTRVHTFTLKDGQAEVRSAGGIDDKMKLVRPNVYETVFQLSGTRLDVVADLTATPRTLTVTEKNRGCKWWATAE